MKVLIFLVARCLRLFCSSRQRSRTLRVREGEVESWPGESWGGPPGHSKLLFVHAGSGRQCRNLAMQPERPELKSEL